MMVSSTDGSDRLACSTTRSPPPSTTASYHSHHETQILIRLNNEKTHVLKFNGRCENDIDADAGSTRMNTITTQKIIQKLSSVANIPSHMLRILPLSSKSTAISTNNHVQTIFLSACTFLPIRGGKGGFGTLLKGQSKQAGARQTTDFGACRDLNGRRLRHVNDEIKLRVWRESMNRRMRDTAKNGGMIDVEKEIEELRTASGIRNWHLMTPSWGAGEMSNKARRKEDMKLRREIERYAKQQKMALEKQMEKKRAFEQTVKDYAFTTQRYLEVEEKKMSKSIIEGMKKRRKVGVDADVAKVVEMKDADNEGKSDEMDCSDKDDSLTTSLLSSSTLCTLSGDVVIEDGNDSSKPTMIQSKSEFATIAVLINPSQFDRKNYTGIYYEIIMESAGMAQFGWAKLAVPEEDIEKGTQPVAAASATTSSTKEGFQPNSDEGDGVGDDAFSYGFDGGRRLSFHNGKETQYGRNINEWKKGDVVGCMHDVKKGIISFSVNGIDLGKAYDYHPPSSESEDSTKNDILYPVLSMNENEVVSLNIGPSFQHCPKDKQAISDLVKADDNISPMESQNDEKAKPSSTERNHDQNDSKPPSATTDSNELPVKEPKSINLDEYNSAEELESIGMSRLKDELYERGLKCGGNLKERASRLFAIKGLSRDEIPKKLRGKNFTF